MSVEAIVYAGFAAEGFVSLVLAAYATYVARMSRRAASAARWRVSDMDTRIDQLFTAQNISHGELHELVERLRAKFPEPQPEPKHRRSRHLQAVPTGDTTASHPLTTYSHTASNH